MLLQARMAAYISDSPKVQALQYGFCWAWLQALGLKKDMSLISDDMSQPIELDNGSTLPPYTWPSDNSFPDDDAFGYPTRDLSFIVEGLWGNSPTSGEWKISFTHKGPNVAPVSLVQVRQNQSLASTMEYQLTKSVACQFQPWG